MKRLILILVVSIVSLQAFSQDMFAGTWKNQIGYEVFIVAIWKAPNGNEVSVLYNSKKPL